MLEFVIGFLAVAAVVAVGAACFWIYIRGTAKW